MHHLEFFVSCIFEVFNLTSLEEGTVPGAYLENQWLKGGLGDFGQKTAAMWLQSAYSTYC